MTSQAKKFFDGSHRLLDILLSIGAFWVAYSIKVSGIIPIWSGLGSKHNYFLIGLIITICWYLSFSFWGVSDLRKYPLAISIRKTVKAILVAFAMLIIALYIFKIPEVSRLLLALFLLFNILFLTLSKAMLYSLQVRRNGRPDYKRHVLVVGTKDRAREVIDKILADRLQNLSLLGCIETDKTLVGTEVTDGVKVLGVIDELETFLRTSIIDEIVFAMPLRKIPDGDKYVCLAEEMGISVRIIPDWQLHYLMRSPGLARINFEQFAGVPTMALHTTPPNEVKLFLKHVFDYCSACIGLVLVSPVMLVIAALIKIFAPGPVFYTQERCGINGRRFRVYKFRTMVVDADQQLEHLRELNQADGPAFKIADDPRIIPYIGKFLRRTSLDELPQFFNILLGQMSLVGPRPPIPSEVNEYDRWHRRRLSMKPGLTCIWQTLPRRNETSFEEWMRLDLSYIDNWSLWLDFKIIMKTGMVLFLAEGR